MFSHQYKLFKFWYILFPPRCIVYLDRCASFKIFLVSPLSFDTTMWFRNLSISFIPKLKSDFSPLTSFSCVSLIRSNKTDFTTIFPRITFLGSRQGLQILNSSNKCNYLIINPAACTWRFKPSATALVFPG